MAAPEMAVTRDDNQFLDEPWWDEDEGDLSDPEDECGRWRNGCLAPWSDCLKAGSEFCDFECPLRNHR